MKSTSNALSSKLTIWNSGASRGRIMFLMHADEPDAQPMKIDGTRFIAFGRSAANALRTATQRASWNVLNEEIDGGFSSGIWQRLRKGFTLESAEINTTDDAPDLTFRIFGENNDRVTLIGHRATTQIDPHRIGNTSVIALNAKAYNDFGRFVRKTTKAQLSTLLHTGGSTANKIRATYAEPRPA